MCKKEGKMSTRKDRSEFGDFIPKESKVADGPSAMAKPPSAMSAKRIDGSRMRDTTGPDLRGGPGMMGREVEKSTCCS